MIKKKKNKIIFNKKKYIKNIIILLINHINLIK
jgi:hypothetical protein